MKNVSKLVRPDKVVQSYFKDEWVNDTQEVRKEYFFNVLNTLYPEYLPNLIKHAANTRFSGQLKTDEEETILCTNDWARELQEHPYFSR